MASRPDLWVAAQAALIKSTLAPTLRRGMPVALAGYPLSWNIGDPALWVAATRILTGLGCPLRYACTPQSYTPEALRRRVPPQGAILLQGGGSVGDVYAEEQALRLRILRDFPDRLIVQLPQTVWYRDAERSRALREAIHAAPQFRFFARDRASLDVARALLTDRAELCPDLVWGLAPLPRHRLFPSCADVLALLRRDLERAPEEDAVAQARAVGLRAEQMDWPPPTAGDRPWTPLDRSLLRWVDRIFGSSATHRPPSRVELAAAAYVTWRKTAWGLVILQRGRAVASNRLHGALLARLLGKPACLLANGYHKNASMHATWLREGAGIGFADTFAEALPGLVERLRSGA